MADHPKFIVDGLLAVGTHNGVHRLIFYALSGTDSRTTEPIVELAIPAPALRSIIDTMNNIR